MTERKEKLLQNTKKILLMIVGTWILSFGTAVFIVPFDMIVGGVSGMALVLDAIIPLEFLTVDLLIAILTWGLFFLGWILLGRGFALKTLVSAAVYPVGVSIIMYLMEQNFLGGILDLQNTTYPELALVVAAVGGGAAIGIGCAMTFLCGGSTGGVDIIAFLICRVIKKLKSSTAIFIIDAVIILSGMLINRDLILSLLGIFSAMITAVVIDRVFLGGAAAFVAQIITDRPEQINRAVIERVKRSTTMIDAVGGYTGAQKKMLLISFNMRQYALLMQVINEEDKNAFVTIHKAHEINGEGWTR